MTSPEKKRSKLNPMAPPFVASPKRRRGAQASMQPPAGENNGVAQKKPAEPSSAELAAAWVKEHPALFRQPFSKPLGRDIIEYVLAWDIETSGPRQSKNSIVAIGAVVVEVATGRVMDPPFRVFIQMEKGHDYSEQCWKEYWTNWEKFPNNERILERIEKEGVHPKKAITEFAEWLDAHTKSYYGRIAITSDNPAYDAAWIGHYFDEYLGRNPMFNPYGDETDYMRIHHSNAYGRAISGDYGQGLDWCQRLRHAGVPVPPDSLHDHDPQHDALWIALLYASLLLCVRNKHNSFANTVGSQGLFIQPFARYPEMGPGLVATMGCARGEEAVHCALFERFGRPHSGGPYYTAVHCMAQSDLYESGYGHTWSIYAHRSKGNVEETKALTERFMKDVFEQRTNLDGVSYGISFERLILKSKGK